MGPRALYCRILETWFGANFQWNDTGLGPKPVVTGTSLEPRKRECQQIVGEMSKKCPKNVRKLSGGAENTNFGHFLDNSCLFGRWSCLETLSNARPLRPKCQSHETRSYRPNISVTAWHTPRIWTEPHSKDTWMRFRCVLQKTTLKAFLNPPDALCVNQRRPPILANSRQILAMSRQRSADFSQFDAPLGTKTLPK